MYDFQDLACAKLILQNYKKKKATFFVEPSGGEDARLIFTDDENYPSCFEIQVKGSREAVTLKSLAECLAHFPARQTSNFLLEQLLTDQTLGIVLIMSGRASDPLLNYLPKGQWNGACHSQNTFNKQDVNRLLDEIKRYSDSLPDTRQNNKRKQYLDGFLKSIDWKLLKRALCRITVLDNENFESLTLVCNRLLREDFNIPDDILKATMSDLVNIIKECKSSQEDAIPLVLEKLNHNPVLSVQPKAYVMRHQEAAWIEQLKESNVLLLSGKPRVGKSDTAKWIAGEFQKQGYAIELTSDPEKAERYLLDTVNAHRLVVLDDPLGSVHASNKSSEKLSLLKRLIPNLRQNRKLIIAQGQERLLEVTDSETLSEASLRGNHWIDLSESSAQFLLSCWASLKANFSIEEQLYLKVYKAIEDEKFDIEPGCLTYLAVEHEKIDASCSLSDILRFSRKDADDLGRELADDGCKDLLVGLAITTNHLEAVDEVDLAYVLSASGALDFGYTGHIATNIFGNERKYEFPHYPNKPELRDSDCLELLEIRRIIELRENERSSLVFTHPYYKSAAESLCNVSTKRSFQEIVRLLKSGIFCLSPATARATARNLYWLYEKAKKQLYKNSIVDIAILGLNSSYPSVRDLCLGFLLDVFEDLDNKYQEKQSQWINKVYGENLEALEWLNGEPWYPMGEHVIVALTWDKYWGITDVERVLEVLSRNDGIPLEPKDSYDVLRYLEDKPEQLTSAVMSRILSVNEGLIRALAANLWIKINRSDDFDILDRIFQDQHPAVAKSIFRSAMKSWDQFDDDRQSYIFSKLAKVANQPVVAHAIIADLVVFERPERMGENPPWKVFSELLPVALSSLPTNNQLDYARLDCAVNEAAKVIPLGSLILILEAWTSLLEDDARRSEPDDYAFAVIDHFLINTGKNHDTRRGLVERLLNINGTGPLVRVISDLLDHWVYLSSEEKERVIVLLSQEREDKYWLKAAILTSRKAPVELLRLVTGNNTIEGLEVNDILSLDQNLLAAGFKMFIGSPQPLWWYATHHREQSVWPKIAENLCLFPDHPLFKVAFMELIGSSGDRQKVCHVIKKLGFDHAEVLFELTLGYYIDSNPEFMPKVWEAIFDLTEDSGVHTTWIKRLASNSLVIFDSLSDAAELIPAMHLDEYYTHFPNDIAILNYVLLAKRIREHKGKEQLVLTGREDVLRNLKSMFELMPPSHYFVCDPVSNLLKRFEYSDEDVSFVKLVRSELLDLKHNWGKSCEVEKIYNWAS